METPRITTLTECRPKHDEIKDGTTGQGEEAKNQVIAKSLKKPNVKPQTPASSMVRGNSFHIKFPEEKDQRELKIR